MPSAQEHECRKDLGLLGGLKHLNPFALSIPGRNESDFVVRKDVFILNSFAFIVLHSDESKLISAYGEILLRHIAAIFETKHVKDDYVTPEIGGELE